MGSYSLLTAVPARPATRLWAKLDRGQSNGILSLRREELRRLGKVEHQGDVYVLGDVEAGVTIEATGTVAVWGSVKGCIIAGEQGDDAVVHAIAIDPGATITVGRRRLLPSEPTPRIVLYPPNESNSQVSSGMAKTALVTGSYATILGMMILFFPVSVYGLLFDTGRVAPGLIRLGGSFLTVIGLQYLGTAIGDGVFGSATPQWLRTSCSFYHSTVISRLFLIVIVTVLVCSNALEPQWLLFAGVNGIGSWSMVRAIHYKVTTDSQTKL